MPLFRIEQYELCMTNYHIEALSQAEAITQLLDGGGNEVDSIHEFLEAAETFGLSVDEHQNLAAELRNLGVRVDEVIPSIRTIEQID